MSDSGSTQDSASSSPPQQQQQQQVTSLAVNSQAVPYAPCSVVNSLPRPLSVPATPQSHFSPAQVQVIHSPPYIQQLCNPQQSLMLPPGSLALQPVNPQLQSLNTAMPAAAINSQQLQALNTATGINPQNLNIPLQPKSPKSPGVAAPVSGPVCTTTVSQAVDAKMPVTNAQQQPQPQQQQPIARLQPANAAQIMSKQILHNQPHAQPLFLGQLGMFSGQTVSADQHSILMSQSLQKSKSKSPNVSSNSKPTAQTQVVGSPIVAGKQLTSGQAAQLMNKQGQLCISSTQPTILTTQAQLISHLQQMAMQQNWAQQPLQSPLLAPQTPVYIRPQQQDMLIQQVQPIQSQQIAMPTKQQPGQMKNLANILPAGTAGPVPASKTPPVGNNGKPKKSRNANRSSPGGGGKKQGAANSKPAGGARKAKAKPAVDNAKSDSNDKANKSALPEQTESPEKEPSTPAAETPQSEGDLPPAEEQPDNQMDTETAENVSEFTMASTPVFESQLAPVPNLPLQPSHGIELLPTTEPKETQPATAIVKPHILTHVIEGFVIQEGPEPFPVNRSSLLVEYDQSKTPTSKAEDTQTTNSHDIQPKQPKVENKNTSELLTCEFCGKSDFRKMFKRSKRFCSTQCSKRFNINCSRRMEHYRHKLGSPGIPTPAYAWMTKRKKKSESSWKDAKGINLPHHDLKDEEVSSEDQSTEGRSTPPKSGSESMSPSLTGKENSDESMDTSQDEKMHPNQWTVEEVVEFIKSVPGCSEYAEEFRVQEIDGQAMLLLKEDHLMTAMNVKLGPALKICSRINSLRDDFPL